MSVCPAPQLLSVKKELGFFSRISVEDNGCWNWTGVVSCNGYGVSSLLGEHRAHRISYRLHYGNITKGNVIMHKCDNRLCCNPEHLQQGTHQENMTDMKDKQRACRIKKKHLTEEQVSNIYLSKCSITQLREQYNLNIRTVERIRAGRIWGHITSKLSRS